MGFVAADGSNTHAQEKRAGKTVFRLGVRAVFFVSLFALAFIGLSAYRGTVSLVAHTTAINQAHQMRAQIAIALDHTGDFQRAARRYLLSGKAQDREQYKIAVRRLPGDLAVLHSLSRTSPHLSSNARQFVQEVERNRANAARLIARRDGKSAPLTEGEEVRLLRGEAESLDNLRELARKFDADTARPLPPQSDETEKLAYQTLQTILLSGLVAVFLSVAAIIVIDHDMHKRVAAEAQLAHSERRFRALIENASDMIALTTAAGQITYISPAVNRILGFEAEQLMRGDIFAPTHPDDQEILHKSFEAVLRAPAGLPTPPVVFRSQRADGAWRWLEATAVNQLSEPGIEAIVATTRDVTERVEAETARKEAEAAVRDSEARLAEAQKIAGIGAWESRPDDPHLHWDARCYEILGFNPDDHPRRETVYARLPPDELERVQAKIQRARDTGERQEFEMSVLHPGGETRHIFVIADRRDGPDHPGTLVGTVQDITDRKRAEQEREALVRELTVSEHRLRGLSEELARSNRDLDDFATAASHDLQEPLRKIQAFSDLIARRAGDRLDATTHDYLDRMQKSARRLETLVCDLLTLSRVNNRPQQAGRSVSLCAVAQAVLSEMEVAIVESGGTVTLGPLPTVVGDPAQMRQLLENLIGNALKFRREGVALCVNVWAEPVITPGTAAFGDKAEAGESWIRLHVSDNGIGFPPEHADRIFKPFERLESRSHYPGNGIGLALCRRIAERHGGAIVAEGRPGEGAAFTVALPSNGPFQVCK